MCGVEVVITYDKPKITKICEYPHLEGLTYGYTIWNMICVYIMPEKTVKYFKNKNKFEKCTNKLIVFFSLWHAKH